MKIRNGFVSNSSSSSFVIVCKKEDHNKAVKKLHPYYQEWIKQKLFSQAQKFAGKDILVSSIHICSEDDEPIAWDKAYPKEAEDYYGDGTKSVPGSDIVSIYTDALRKISGDVICETIDG